MRRDTIFYQLFQQSPTLLFELLPQPPANAARYTFEAVEVKETAFRMDGVFLPPDLDGIVYFCEAQFQKDEILYEKNGLRMMMLFSVMTVALLGFLNP